MALAWLDEARNARGDATFVPRRWTIIVLDKGDGSEDEGWRGRCRGGRYASTYLRETVKVTR